MNPKPRCKWDTCREEPEEGFDYCPAHRVAGVAKDDLAKALRWATREETPKKAPNVRAKLHATLNKAVASGQIVSPADYLHAPTAY